MLLTLLKVVAQKNLINVSKETDQKLLHNLFCNYEIQPKRLRSNFTLKTPSPKKTAIQHLSSSPRPPKEQLMRYLHHRQV